MGIVNIQRFDYRFLMGLRKIR